MRRAARSAAVLTALVLAAGCSAQAAAPPLESSAGAAGTPAPTTPTTEATTTTTAPPPPAWPLTGLPEDDPAAAAATGVIAVKIDNSPDARPHAGINAADQVYELQVEGITRFMVLFNSTSPERIGPIRSARSSDLDLLGNLNRPLLAWSGGNPGVTAAVQGAQANGLLIDVSHSAANPEYYRDDTGGRFAPHNLFSNIAGLRAHYAPPDTTAPLPMFVFRQPGEALPASALDAPGMTIDFGLGVRVDYAWDAERSCWDRFQVDERHPRDKSAFVDEAGVQVCPDNVVILFLPYTQDTVDARSPKALSVGSGTGVVLTGGKAIGVNWSRSMATDTWNLTDAATGGPVPLTPGRTWVALPQQDADQALPMDVPTAAGLLATKV